MRIFLALIAASALAQTNLQSPVTARRYIGQPGEYRVQATDGTFGGWKGPSSFTGSPMWKLPTADGTGCFKSDGSLTTSLVPCGYWSRDSGAGYVYPTTSTDDVRTKAKIQFEGVSSSFVQDIQAQTDNDAGTQYMAFRDKAGGEMLRLLSRFVGAPDRSAIFDMKVYPLTDNTRDLGQNTRRWANLFAQTLGSSGTRINKLWVQDIDCAGSCGTSGWTRDVSGFLVPTTATDDVRVRKLQMLDSGGSGLMWDIFPTLANPAVGTNAIAIRDNAGAEVLRLERSFLGSATNNATLDMNLIPLTDGTRNIGSSSNWYNDIRGTNVYTATLRPKAGSTIDVVDVDLRPTTSGTWNLGQPSSTWKEGYIDYPYVKGIAPQAGTGSTILHYGHWTPSADNTWDYATSAARPRKAYLRDVDISGTCTGSGCGGGLFTDGGATTYLTATGDNLCIGCTSTSRKLQVNGDGEFTSNLYTSGRMTIGTDAYWSTDAGGDIGTATSNRPASIHAATALFTYDGSGSTVIRTRLSGSGLLIQNSSGTTMFSVSGTTGTITVNGGGTGQTYTTSGGCVFTKGILTGGTC